MACLFARTAHRTAGIAPAVPLLGSTEQHLYQVSIFERCFSGASASTSSTTAADGRPSVRLPARALDASTPAQTTSLFTLTGLSGVPATSSLLSHHPSPATRRFASAAAAVQAAAAPAADSAVGSTGGGKAGEVPWPWVDPSAPRWLPQPVVRERKPTVPLKAALEQLLGSLTAGQRHTHSLEAQVRFALDPRRSDHLVRGSVVLPYGTGKQIRLVVFAKGVEAEIAREMGVDLIGDEDLIASIVSSNGAAINFDKLIATPDFMKPLARAGKVLGPKGLMPNPKLGTLTSDVATAISEIRRGRLDYRVGRDATIRAALGRAAMPADHLAAHVGGLVASLLDNKPKALGGPMGRSQQAAGAAAATAPAAGVGGAGGQAAAAAAAGSDGAKTSAAALDGYVMRFLLKTSYSSPVRITSDSLAEAADEYRRLVGSGAAGLEAGAGVGTGTATAAEAAAATAPKAAKATEPSKAGEAKAAAK